MAKSIFNKLFISTNWHVAIKNNEKVYKSIPSSRKYWFADPLLFSTGENVFLFCEAFDRKKMKGDIGVFDLNSKENLEYSIIIKNNYHMSFPYVFEHAGFFYMIPETSEIKQMEIYKSIEFPLKWKKEAVLVSGLSLVDTIVFDVDGKLYLYSYDNNKMIGHFYKLNISTYTVEEVNVINFDKNIGRPGGRPFFVENELIIPLQDSKEEYGKKLLFRSIVYKNGTFEFDDCDFLLPDVTIEEYKKIYKYHTYSIAKCYEAIDFCTSKFDLLKRFKIFKRSILQKRRKNN